MNQVKVQLTKSCCYGKAGDIKQLHFIKAEQLVKDRFAVTVKEDQDIREERKEESQKLQNKVFKEKSKRSRGVRSKPDNKALSAAG